MTDDTNPLDGISRRTVMKASAVGAGALATSGTATARDDNDDAATDENDETDVDEPDGFEVEVIGDHATFPDEVGATFALVFGDDDGDEDDGTMGSNHTLDDTSTIVVADVTWDPCGTSGWHRHPGSALVNIVEGELDVTWERDCITRTYAAGEGFFDPGEVHIADNVSDDENARAYVVFLGIPDGEPATEWVEPVDC